jgi:uncharacterized membrane protein
MATAEQQDDAPTRAKRDDKVDDLAVVGKSILINRPRSELFAYWQNFSNLPSFMDNLDKVELQGQGRWRWTIKAPLGRTVAIETQIGESVPDQSISWMSTDASEIKTNGRVDFTDASSGRGTVVTLEIAYDPPGGDLGRVVAKLLAREPNIQARQELKRFKMLMEAGEVAKGPDQLRKED